MRYLIVIVLVVLAVDVHADRIVLLVDNSGSMRVNDVDRLVPAGVTRFIASLPESTQIAVVAFDERGRLIQPLIRAPEFDPGILDQLDYQGPWTDLALAVERGLYELRMPHDGHDAVLMITDGIMDTGSPEGDLRAEGWLTGDLTRQMTRHGISMWVVALTEEADFRVLHPITRRTGGDYHRALTATDVGTAMARVRDGILGSDPVTAPPAVAEAPAPEARAETPPPPVPDDSGSLRWLLASALILFGSGVLGWVAIRTTRARPLPDRQGEDALEYFPECYLVDLHGVTHAPTHPLRGKYNMITRLHRPPDDGINYIQIFRRQIGRRHALIEYRDFSFWVIDQQSVNGTWLNGERVTRETRLKHGDRIRFYRYEFEYCVSDLALSNETLIADRTHEP